MTETRSGIITFKSDPMTLVGPELKPGDQAPDFTLVGSDLSPVSHADFDGKPLVLSIVPSIDTGVCATQTRTFNEKATDLADYVTVLTVSMDLPFAQQRFCGAEGIERVQMASDYKDHAFGKAWGLRIEELGLLTRAVIVVDREGKIAYVQIVPEVTDEPDYDKALEALRAVC